MRVGTLKELMAGNDYAEILCLYKGEVVRKLTVNGDTLHVDALTESVDLPLDTPVIHDPWFMDRGNMLVNGLKLCTEADKIRYPDGTVDSVHPSENLRHAGTF